MILPANYNLPPCIVGCTYDEDFTIYVDGAVKDLTSCTVSIPLYQNGALLDTLTNSHYLTITPLEGIIAVLIPSTVTANYIEGIVTYHVNITEADAKVYRYLEGTFEVRE